MEKFTEESLRQLAVVNQGPCVSMYVPARNMGANSAIDITRVKNLMRTAESNMAAGAFGEESAELLNPLHEMLADHSVWNESAKGLAIFISPGLFKTYRIPIEIEESVTVASRFDVAPLLSLAMDEEAFLLLSLSQNHIQLFRGTQQDFEAIDLDKELGSVEEFMSHVESETQSHVHSGLRTVHSARSKENAVFYGAGSSASRKKDDLHDFFRAVDHKVAHIAGATGMPLLLAGVDHVRAIYRDVSKYSHIADAEIEKNIDQLPTHELHDIGLALVQPYFNRKMQSALEKFHSLAGTGLTSERQDEIAAAAGEGRVEVLFVASQPRVGSAVAESMPGDFVPMELIGPVIATDGKVYAVAGTDLPAHTSAAAIMRY